MMITTARIMMTINNYNTKTILPRRRVIMIVRISNSSNTSIGGTHTRTIANDSSSNRNTCHCLCPPIKDV